MSWFSRRFAKNLISGKEGVKIRQVAERRKRLLSGLSGVVLEIGPGAGVNFDYYPRNIRWIGVEPNPVLCAELRKCAQERGIENAKVYEGRAEHLPVSEASVDIVVSAQVLCSVKNSQQVLSEIRRVLKPNGKFIFIEHVGASKGTLLRLIQNVINPWERLIGDGCNANRDTLAAIEHAGFSRIESEQFINKEILPWPYIAGTAKK